jgi:hypothetical protein
VNGEVTLGPAVGDTPFVVSNSGDYYDSVTKADAAYAVEVDSASEYGVVFYPDGQISVGSLSSSGSIEGRDTIQVAGQVSFSMTIAPTSSLTSSASQPISIPIYFVPTFSGYCETVTKTSVGLTQTSGCEANASASITDNTTGATQSANLSIPADGSATSSPVLQFNAYAGDTITIDLSTSFGLEGHDWFCSVPGSSPAQYYECGGLIGAEGNVMADPLFEFDQAAFDAEMGANTFNLADNYGFSFSPNISESPIPEPSSLFLFGTGLLILLPWLRRRLGRA